MLVSIPSRSHFRVSAGVGNSAKKLITLLHKKQEAVTFVEHRYRLVLTRNLFWNYAPLSLNILGEMITTVHDFIAIKNSKYPEKLLRLLWLYILFSRSKKLICISEYVSNDLNIIFKNRFKNKVIVVPWGYENEKIRHIMIARQPNVKLHFLSVTNKLPHKNNAFLIDAYETYRSLGGRVPLIVVGGSAKICYDGITFLNNIQECHLHKLYLDAIAFISTSTDEGFALPVAEAYSEGIPTILSDIPVFRELYIESIFFDVSSVMDLAVKMKGFQSNKSIYEKRQKIWSWSDSLDKITTALT